ncbi:MAG TPA: HAMP domain-containing sensor histidine kinase [Opitutaceae bacterium]|nr:HAMP domain-containing sensor histidine kinase [Opitutaceae bacterium]
MNQPAEPEVDPTELRRLISAQARLVRAVHDLSLVRTVAAIQDVVRHAAREIVQADGATFVLRDGECCYYADEDAISPLWKGQRFPMSACISGWVMHNAQHAAIPDIYADPRVPTDAYRPTFVKSLVMVPIRVESPLGAIGTYWARERAASGQEIELLQALANTTAVAMENVQVYSELERRVALRTRQMEAVNQELEAFSYSVSHDLRAPLRAIRGFIELLEHALKIPDLAKAQGHAGRVREGAARMTALTEDLLQLAQVTRKRLSVGPVDLAALAREIVGRLQAEDPGRDVRISIPDTLPACGDAGLLHVVLENLVGNAWKYTAKTPQAHIELGREADDDGAMLIWIRDNGVGFRPEDARKLFAPFQRLHSAAEFPGTGIGLATVQRIINRHGGQIWATAEPGRGATFRFRLPASA